jgi:chitosanase
MTNNGNDVHRALGKLQSRVEDIAENIAKPKPKGFFERLESLSPLITGVLIAGVGTFATYQYKTTQTKLAALEALDKYRAYLTSDDAQERAFGYEAFVALGEEEFVARLIGVRGDVAGETVLQVLAESGKDVAVRDAARKSLLNLPQERRIMRIVNILESGTPNPDYSRVTILPGDPGHLTYGAVAVNLASGDLYSLVKAYVSTPEAAYHLQLKPYLARLEAKDLTLDHDQEFREALRLAGHDPVMQRVQDEAFRRLYFEPAYRSALAIGIKSLLGIAVVYDSRVHGSWRRFRDKTSEEIGGTPLDGIDERRWIKAYLKVRAEWLRNHNIPVVRRTAYRPEAFLELAEKGNWDLLPPLDIRGQVIAD